MYSNVSKLRELLCSSRPGRICVPMLACTPPTLRVHVLLGLGIHGAIDKCRTSGDYLDGANEFSLAWFFFAPFRSNEKYGEPGKLSCTNITFSKVPVNLQSISAGGSKFYLSYNNKRHEVLLHKKA